MVALNKNVAMEDMCEHQTTLCKVKREFFVKQEKISTFLPSKDNRREAKRREGDKDKGETLIILIGCLYKWKVEAVLLLRFLRFFQQKQSILRCSTRFQRATV